MHTNSAILTVVQGGWLIECKDVYFSFDYF